MTDYQISSEAELRALMGEPVHELITAKSADRITAPMRRFIGKFWDEFALEYGELWWLGLVAIVFGVVAQHP